MSIGCSGPHSCARNIQPPPYAGVSLVLAAVLAVEFFMDFAQVRVGDVRVNLRRVDRSMTEKLLDGTDISPVTE